jgi:hypothetical protein
MFQAMRLNERPRVVRRVPHDIKHFMKLIAKKAQGTRKKE